MLFPIGLFPIAFGLSWMEMSVILIVALLLFGKRLPEVMRSMGKGIVEFKKGLHGIEDEIEGPQGGGPSGSGPPDPAARPRTEPTGPSGTSPTAPPN